MSSTPARRKASIPDRQPPGRDGHQVSEGSVTMKRFSGAVVLAVAAVLGVASAAGRHGRDPPADLHAGCEPCRQSGLAAPAGVLRSCGTAGCGRAGTGEHGVLRRPRAGDAQDLPRLWGWGEPGAFDHTTPGMPGERSRRGCRPHDRLHQGDGRDEVGRRLDAVLRDRQRPEHLHPEPGERLRRCVVRRDDSDSTTT